MLKDFIGGIQICLVTPLVHCLQPLVCKMNFPDGIVQPNSAPASVDMRLYFSKNKKEEISIRFTHTVFCICSLVEVRKSVYVCVNLAKCVD